MGERRAYVFIDEIQRKENAGLFLKGLYDSRLPYKFIVSGSGSLELKEKIKESLVGRKRIFELGPVNIEEFIAHRTGYQFEERLGEWVRLAPAELEPLLLEYLNFGGYPRVILADNYAEKAEVLEEILGSYLDRDIRILLQLEKSHAFSLMLRLAGAFRHLPEMGAVFENFIFQILHNWYATIVNPVKYWRTKDKAEVDFVVEKGLHPLPVEAKCQSLRKPTISRSFRNFINTYAPEEAWVVNPDYHNEIRLGNTLVRFRPWYDLVWHDKEM